MKFDITNRWTGKVMFTCELNAEVAGQIYCLQLGFAVKKAVEAGANLLGANLIGANLIGADLRYADLRYADLRYANLRDADLRYANLRDADLRYADLRDTNLICANLSGADLLSCPIKIKNIHSTIYAAASKDGALNMTTWSHSCGTTHCRAGWVVALAGEGGKALEFVIGTPAAAALIYMASDPAMQQVPDFYCDNETALADMKRLAEQEVANGR